MQVFDLSSYPDNARASLGLPDHGEVITGVQAGSPAAAAGLQAADEAISVGGQPFPAGGDVILSIDGTDATDAQELQNAIFAKNPGDKVTLGVWRNHQEKEVPVLLKVVPLEGTQSTLGNG